MGRQLGLTEVCQFVMPDGDICGKTRDNCQDPPHRSAAPSTHTPGAQVKLDLGAVNIRDSDMELLSILAASDDWDFESFAKVVDQVKQANGSP